MLAALGPTPYPVWVRGTLLRAQQAAASGHPEAALAAIDQATRFEPALAFLHLDAARFALQAGDPTTARDHLGLAREAGVSESEIGCLTIDTAPAGAPASPVPDDDLARCAAGSPNAVAWTKSWIGDGHLEQARLTLSLMVEANPEGIPAWERFAGLTELLAPSATERVIQRAYAFDPAGTALLDQIWALARATDDVPSAEASAQLGEAFATAGDWTMAAASFRHTVALEPSFPRARAYLGTALERIGADGLPELFRAGAEAPDDPLVRTLIGDAWIRRGEPVLASRELAWARALEPQDPAIASLLGSALSRSGDYSEAAEAHLSATVLAPSNAYFWNALAGFCLEQGYQVEQLGLPSARNAVALSAPSSEALSSLGFSHAVAGRLLLGERLLARSLAIDPWDSQAWYRLGITLLDSGRLLEARSALENAIRFDRQGNLTQLAERTMEQIP